MEKRLPTVAALRSPHKKRWLLLALLAFASGSMVAQTKIGDNPGTPRDPSAMLEVSSTAAPYRGLLMPRLTTAQRDAITNPAKGLMIFNTTTNQVEVNGGTPAAPLWTTAAPPSTAWLLLGNTGINPATQFIGTTDLQPVVFRTKNLERMRLDSNGYLGIGNNAPLSPLSFASADGAKITLWDGGSDSSHYGFGITGTYLNYHVIDTSATHRFLAGGKSGTGKELMRIQGDGNIGVGTVAPAQKLDVAGTARISGSAGTATAVTGRNAAGDISNLTLGTGLSIAGGVLNTTGAAGWGLTGNAGTAPATNFIGTTDAQPLVFRTNNVEQARLLANGNLGIGTTTANSPLSFASADGAKITFWDGGSTTAHYGLGITGTFLNYHVLNTTAAHRFFAGGKNGNGTELMRIQGDGNVGIGTGAPQNRLDLGTGRGATTADVTGKKLSVYNFTDGNDFYGLGVSTGVLQFHAASTPTEEPGMILNSVGNVGVGTVAPAQKLDVAGTARISGSAGTATAVTGRNAAGDISNLTLGAGLTITGGVLNTTGAGASGWGITGNAATNPATNFIGTSDAQPLVFRTNNVEQARLLANGNLGIGTTTANSPLSFASADGAKITLYDGGSTTAHYGFGITGTYLNYHVLNNTAAHRFFAGGKNGDGTELMRIQGDGNIGIGTGAPHSLLDMGTVNGATTSAAAGKKLAVYNIASGNDFYGLGVSTGVLQFHAASQPTEEPGMILNSTGRVGIGTTNPSAMLNIVAPTGNPGMMVQGDAIAGSTIPLTVQTTASSNNSLVALRLNSLQTGSVGNLDMGVSGTAGSLQMYTQPGNIPGNIALNAQSGGNVGIGTFAPTARLSVNGDANNTTGVWGVFSDSRIKTVDEQFTDGLETVMKIRPVKFHYNNDAPFTSNAEQIGIVAQEMEAIAPYMISKEKIGKYNDLRKYNAQALPYMLVNAIQELKKELDGITQTNASLQQELGNLKAENAQLKADKNTMTELLARLAKLESTLGVASK